ncbi:hypothetical protein ACFFRR_008251 [Megaselia abdita]
MIFLKKVFGVLALQLIISFGIMTLFIFVKDFEILAQHMLHCGPWIIIVVLLTTASVLFCGKNIRQNIAITVILSVLLTLSYSSLLGLLAAILDPLTVLVNILVAGLLIGLTTLIWRIFRFNVPNEVVIISAVLYFVFTIVAFVFPGEIIFGFYSSCGVLLFLSHLLYDLQFIIGDKKEEIFQKEYVFTALILYIEISCVLVIILGT